MLPPLARERIRGNPAAPARAEYHSNMRFLPWPALLGLAATLFATELKPRSYAYLFSHARVVAAGRVRSVSSGFLSEGREALIDVEGLFKGRVRSRELKVVWSDAEFEETAYRSGVHVVVFLTLAKDSSWNQVSPGISCWPVEKIEIKGKTVRAVEYGYPLGLLTGIPARSLGETKVVEKSMNFEIPKRKAWILTDRLLPAPKPVVLLKRRPGKPGAGKPGKAAKRKPAKAKPAAGERKSLF